MGRRATSVADGDRWVFNRLATDYRARPGYPAALVKRLLELAGGPGAGVADLGAGSGLLSLPLALGGARVVAVEPAAAMLAVLRERCAGHPVVPVHAAAEDTGLGDRAVALVVAADVLQWLDPELAGREAARILPTGGALAVVEARLSAEPFPAAIAELLRRANPRARPRPPERLAQFFRAAGATPSCREAWHHAEALSPGRLDAVLRSLSLVGPALGPRALGRLLAEAGRLAELHGGAVWARDILLTWGRRGPT